METKKRLIDAMKMVTKISKKVKPLLGSPIAQHIYDVILQCIAEAPTVDAVEVVHGRWEEVTDQDEIVGEMDFYKCSVCGKLRWFETNYCPNCGAKMDL